MSESKLTYITGDIFTAPPNSILVHACNTQGFWGAGIALSFKAEYPAQFKVYEAHCKEHGQAVIGTCLLIPGETHDIACLFTSKRYGRGKDSVEEILNATREAVGDLIRQNGNGKELHACRFNSGMFGVPWSGTEDVLKELDVAMTIYTPPGGP